MARSILMIMVAISYILMMALICSEAEKWTERQTQIINVDK